MHENAEKFLLSARNTAKTRIENNNIPKNYFHISPLWLMLLYNYVIQSTVPPERLNNPAKNNASNNTFP